MIAADLQSYPLFVTRDLDTARTWLRSKRCRQERMGLLASSNAARLKPDGIFVKAKTVNFSDNPAVRGTLSPKVGAGNVDSSRIYGVEIEAANHPVPRIQRLGILHLPQHQGAFGDDPEHQLGSRT